MGALVYSAIGRDGYLKTCCHGQQFPHPASASATHPGITKDTCEDTWHIGRVSAGWCDEGRAWFEEPALVKGNGLKVDATLTFWTPAEAITLHFAGVCVAHFPIAVHTHIPKQEETRGNTKKGMCPQQDLTKGMEGRIKVESRQGGVRDR